MKIVVTCNDDVDQKSHLNPFELQGEAEVVETANEIVAITGGVLLPVRNPVANILEELRRIQPDVVINLCEGVAGNPRWEMHFALSLEMLGIPFTGCDPIAMGVCQDKSLTKRLLMKAGISTPIGFAVTDPASLPPIEWPCIVKPSLEDAGVGVEAASVCRNRDEAVARCRFVLDTYRQPALVEQFIDGREFNQAMFTGRSGVVVLPPGEIVFDDELMPSERVVGFRAKWNRGSKEDRATTNRTPADLDPEHRDRIVSLCLSAASLLGLEGYCRFDLRQSASGELFIIDVNPNPDLGEGAGFRRALEAAGIAFSDFLNELMMAALTKTR